MREVLPKQTNCIDISGRRPLDLKTLEEQFIEENTEENYNPFRISQLQSYNPIYSVLCRSEEELAATASVAPNIHLHHRYHINDLFTVEDTETGTLVDKNIFIKSAPLLDPIRYMIGKYNSDNSYVFPSIGSAAGSGGAVDKNSVAQKLADRNNTAYVDTFFCYLTNLLLSKHGFVHGIEYYGSFSGVQEKYKFDISDDFEYLSNSTFFVNNNEKLFITNMQNSNSDETKNTKSNKIKLNISDVPGECHEIEINELDVEEILEAAPEVDLEEIYVKDPALEFTTDNSDDDSSDADSDDDCYDADSDDDSDTPDNDAEEETSENSDWETEENASSNDEDEKEFAYIYNFPVQLICTERCHGTLDELLEKNDNFTVDEAICALFQIIMILITYQKAFHFTHNDLHTNNIMYIKTEQKFLYYKFNSDYYRVPTFGKIYKIIDFGRAIYKFNSKLFCSDSFAPEGDAATQYNFEPYINEKKARIDPNYSFDLCRLGSSIYDFIIDDCEEPVDKMNPFQKIINTWCQDDSGRNILYKKNGEERYHNFKLYKMIARTVHNHNPETQLKLPIFKKFLSEGTIDKDIAVVDIDAIPCYANTEC